MLCCPRRQRRCAAHLGVGCAVALYGPTCGWAGWVGCAVALWPRAAGMTIGLELAARIRRLYEVEHWRVGTIATQLHVHRDTVRRVLHEQGAAPAGVPLRRSDDKQRKTLVLSQFDVEIYVNTYWRAAPSRARWPRWCSRASRSRTSRTRGRPARVYEFPSDDDLVEVFELAPPDQPWRFLRGTQLRRTSRSLARHFEVWPGGPDQVLHGVDGMLKNGAETSANPEIRDAASTARTRHTDCSMDRTPPWQNALRFPADEHDLWLNQPPHRSRRRRHCCEPASA